MRYMYIQFIFIPFHCRFQCVISRFQGQLTVFKFKAHRRQSKQQLINILRSTKHKLLFYNKLI